MFTYSTMLIECLPILTLEFFPLIIVTQYWSSVIYKGSSGTSFPRLELITPLT